MREPTSWRRQRRFFRPDVDADVDDELRFHVEQLIADHVARGQTRAGAERLAAERFGSYGTIRRALRRHDARRLRHQQRAETMDTLLQDVRYGVRKLLQAPGFTLGIVLVLALGLGANTAVFTAADAAFFRPLPFAAPERLVRLHSSMLELPMDMSRMRVPGRPPEAPRKSRADLTDLLAQRDVFAAAAGHATGAVNLVGGEEPMRVAITYVTGGFFDLLGRRPAFGRAIAAGDTAPGAPPVAILSDGLWQRQFGGDRRVLGRRVLLNGVAHEVVGIMPRDFRFPSTADLWVPIAMPVDMRYFEAFRNYMPTQYVARLVPGATVAQAAARLDAVRRQYTPKIDADDPSRAELAAPLQSSLVGARRTALLMLVASALLVLLLACANVTNLLLARGAVREREIALRAVLGASRGRIVRQLLVESLLLAAVAGVASLLVAWVGLGAITKVLPPALAGIAPARLDARTVGFTFAVALGTGVLFGLWPAFGATRGSPGEAVKSGTAGATRRHRGSAQPVIVVAEVTLATMLLIGAGLTLQSLRALLGTDAGFRADRLATAQLTLPSSRYASLAARTQFADAVIARLRAMPGVRTAAVTTALPLAPEGGIGLGVRAEGAPEDGPMIFPRYLMASPGYFETMGITILRGADLPAVADSTHRVAVINRTLGDSLWPGQDALGKRFVFGPEVRTVIGVIADVRLDSLNLRPRPQMYLPLAEQSQHYMTIVARTTRDDGAVVARLRDAVRRVDPQQPVYNARMMRDVVDASVSLPRTNATLLTIFGVVAVLVASVGVYALLAFGVAQRTRELAVRVALGARARDLVGLTVRSGLALATTGVVVGTAAAYGLARFVRALLYEVSPHDPRVFVLAPLTLLVVALVATWLPARQGAAVSPMLVMRGE